MRFIRAICRIVFALTFILSGFLKLVDPVGTGLIIKEYFDFLHLGFLDPIAVEAGIALATLEFTVGVAVLLGLKMNIFATIALAMTGFFTLMTLYLFIFNPISDCGCFGEAIHLTNGQTFFKNIILLALGLIFFFGRKKATKIAPNAVQWVFVALFAGIGLTIALNAYHRIPQIDFTAYNPGTDLSEGNIENQARYETVFIYEKDGHREKFALENIPDESWTFVDSETTLVGGSTKNAQIDFVLDKKEGPLFAVTVYSPDKLSEKTKKEIDTFTSKVLLAGGEAIVYGPTEEFDNIADRKSLLTLNRSNGGVVFFNDGVIVRKWCSGDISKIDVAETLEEDPDVIIIKQRIHQQMFVSALLIGILFLALLLRYICRIVS